LVILLSGCATTADRPITAEPPVSTKVRAISTEEFKGVAGRESFIWPVSGNVISAFNSKSGGYINKGIDIGVREGTDVKASKSGRVSFRSEGFRGYGKIIILDHGNNYETVYAYNSENVVSSGVPVKQGDVIARTGVNPRTNEPALHFEVRKKSEPVDPLAQFSRY